jgi:Domain of unknown function (DUF4936)
MRRSASREGKRVSAAFVSYYVYYRVDARHESAARRAVASMLISLEQRTAVIGRLMRRQEDPLLWMEIYDSVRDPLAFETVLSELLPASGLAALLEPGAARHTERFVPAVS